MTTIAQHWIDGRWTGSGSVLESISPADGTVVGSFYDGGEAEASAAVDAAAAAFETTEWARTPRSGRPRSAGWPTPSRPGCPRSRPCCPGERQAAG